jgi:hypothetical protein
MNDDEYGMTLLAPLRGEPAAPPAIDVPKAMRDGRRLRGRRWWAGGSALLAALVGGSLLLAPGSGEEPRPTPRLPPDPTLPATCTLSRLPMGSHPSAEVNGGDASGRWHVGNASPASKGTESPMLIWHDGKLVTQAPTPLKHLKMYDVNAAGVAVGYNSGGVIYPYAFQNGKFVRLKGGIGEAVAINDDGTIVGALGHTNTFDGAVPVRWKSVDAEPERLKQPGGSAKFVKVVDVSEAGTILGEYNNPGGVGYLWQSDGGRWMESPPRSAGEQPIFRPYVQRFGWVYAQVLTLQSQVRDSGEPAPPIYQPAGTYRYEPHSHTWQKLTDGMIERSGALMLDMDQDPAIFVGPKLLKVPRDPKSIESGLDAFVLKTSSEDGRTVAGYAINAHADLSLPYQPILWRCE